MRQLRIESSSSSASISRSSFLLSLLLVLVGATAAGAQTAAPTLFFTDLTSGPNSGGESVSGFSGAYVTLYGNNFGATQGSATVTLNGANCLRVVSWGSAWMWYQTLVVQLSSTCTSGNFAVTTSQGPSNGLAFTVRSGNIYCVSSSGSDSNAGKFPNCWATIPHSVHSGMAAGDTTYVQTMTDNKDDNHGAIVDLTNGGNSQATPMALIVYPGSAVQLNTTNSDTYSMRTPAVTGPLPGWTIAGFTMRGANAVDLDVNYVRLVGNDISCTGSTNYGCLTTTGTNNSQFYGNNLHNMGQSCAGNSAGCKLYENVYLAASNNTDFGWNIIDPDPQNTGTAGCRGYNTRGDQTGSGTDILSALVHDNIIRNVVCDGINLPTINPSDSGTKVYNNVVYHVGEGSSNVTPGNFTCLNIDSYATESGSVQVYNNTFYDCGGLAHPVSGASSSAGAFSIGTGVHATLTNNIFSSLSSSEPYIAPESSSNYCSAVTGSNNLWFGAGASPSCGNLTSSLNSDPLFVSPGTNFQLQSSSPAIDKAVSVAGLGMDILGTSRPQGAALDIGAYEFQSGAAPKPNPPTMLSIAVQ
jgi:hypothetical protein